MKLPDVGLFSTAGPVSVKRAKTVDAIDAFARIRFSSVGSFISMILEIPLTSWRIDGNFEDMKLSDAAAQLEALGNPTRLKIYRTLVKVGESGLPVGHLQARLGAAPSTLSHHLQKLIQVELVTQERQATTLICRANYPVMNALVGFLTEECCVEERSCKPSAA